MDTLFWYGAEAEVGDVVQLDERESKHVGVFRVSVGGPIELADGHGKRLVGIVVERDRRSTRVAVESVESSDAEPVSPLILGFPPLRSGRTETLLEKGTELGVTTFVPVISDRSRQGEMKPSRLSRVIRAAAMQCGRCRLPILEEAQPLLSWCRSLPPEIARFAARPEGESRATAGEAGSAAVVGPEGDFTDAEWAVLAAAGFQLVDLGARRLRSETAGIVLVSRLGTA